VKKLIAITMAVVLLLTMAVSVPVAANPETHVYPGPGTPIQDAIDAATAGDTIIVHEGTYNENVLVNRDVTLQSAEKNKAEIVGVAYTGDAIRITADGATVEGFLVIIAAAHDGIAVKADNVAVRNNKVKGPGPFTGHVPPTGAGISVILADGVTVEGNSIHETSGVGIWMGDASGCTIKDNHVAETQYTGILLAPYGPPCDNNLVEGNHVVSAGTEWCYDDGIRLGWGAHDNTLRNNKVNASIRDGIRAVGTSHDNIIQSNTMRGNGIPATDGVDAHDLGTDNTWTGNKFRTSSGLP
jgi:parallel beta-helix repeat protein